MTTAIATYTCAGYDFTLLRPASHHVEYWIPSLASLLQDCVNPKPSQSALGYLAPLEDFDAKYYWRTLRMKEIAREHPTTYLYILTNGLEIAGTVQIGLMHKETHDHRGEIRKLLVAPKYRSMGLGKWLVGEMERIARVELGLEMLMLDTAVRTPAREFYLRQGWSEWGICPDYSRAADGTRCDVAFFYKRLEGGGEEGVGSAKRELSEERLDVKRVKLEEG